MKHFRLLLLPLALSSALASDPIAPSARPPVAVDRAYLDAAASPTDDFYAFANGAFASTPIPGEYPAYGVNQEIDERNNLILREILETSAAEPHAPPGSIAQRVGDFYAAGMDEAAIERAGLKPLQPWFDRIDAARTPDDLAGLLAALHRIDVGAGFSFWIQVDDKDSSAMIAALHQGGLGLPDRDYYFRDDDHARRIREAYVAHVARVLSLSGDAAADASAAKVMALETRLAEKSRTLVERRDPEKNYHKLAIDALPEIAPGLAWKRYFASLDFPSAEKNVLVGQPEFFAALSELLGSEPIDTWRSYLRWQLLHGTAPYLTKAFVDQHFEFFGRTLRGTTEQKPRWKRVLAAADSAIGEDLGQLYVRRAFSPTAKARAQEMIAFHLQAMRDRIAAADWMSERTKTQAYRKLDTMRSKIGYPDVWRDYAALTIARDSYVQNMLAASEFESARQLAKLGHPVDRNEWFMTPQTNNAYYDPTLNEMCYPAGILQPPFFDENADDAANYGALASTIGHELTHGFDDQGRQYDADGNLADWWTEADAAAFTERANHIVRQYDSYEVLPGLHLNGSQTLGENIADIGGLRVAYEAYRLATANKRLREIDGFTPDQRFFIAFAQGWRTNYRPEYLRMGVASDVHSPARWRVIGPVTHFPEFYQAFGKPVPADNRPAIW